MWFDFVHGKEKINFMFNNELSIDDSEIDNFLFYDLSKIRVCFNTRNIPKKTPDKWRNVEFNGLSITLILVGISKLNLQGDRVGFICSPIIEKIDDEMTFTIDNGDKFHFSCAAEIIVIDSIEPYLDQRWK
ncbi:MULTISPECIES: Imm50 family immunity protein [unclassified Brenneria]|uniref:Imm50 family immunity protein n=1 Tax=unclassified Brenneria TaxID=2634434 RepID=UPI0029C46817|nr:MULTISPECIES: Imm50 family immunity protein [unclassified Brenneria]MDX5630940.1 Imm50 family immunity protein [Brenneria sp. L3-3Z]MDX5698021.1 Imm50 family immunity protein [Brenneria sp. L4-2C]